MKQKTNELLKMAKGIYGENCDLLIVSRLNDHCNAVSHGATDRIAESIFAAILTPNNTLAPVLYRIIKLNVENILKNPSPYAVDLLETFSKALSDDE